ncbi:MAG: DUF2235 domain-containing protein [Paracoccaceae bacterium]
MARTHVVIIDGTLSRLGSGEETNAGLLYKLLSEMLPRTDLLVHYHPGIRGEGLQKWFNIAAGIGINQAICSGYTALSRKYTPGDKILLFGFSRGAYAVRSLSGMIGRIGLLKSEHVTNQRVQRAFRHYERNNNGPRAASFTRAYCHSDVKIELVGVWDTVKALGLPFPVLTRFAPAATEFHDHRLGPTIANAYQALALDETRHAFRPILWDCLPDWHVRVEQLWFPGTHSDIGGNLEGFAAARPLSNIPFVWMLENATTCGLPLPEGWQSRFPTDPAAEMVGAYAGMSKFFLNRAPRRACDTPFDKLHPSVAARQMALEDYQPKAIICEPKSLNG